MPPRSAKKAAAKKSGSAAASPSISPLPNNPGADAADEPPSTEPEASSAIVKEAAAAALGAPSAASEEEDSVPKAEVQDDLGADRAGEEGGRALEEETKEKAVDGEASAELTGEVPDEGDEEAKESMQGSAEALGSKDGEVPDEGGGVPDEGAKVPLSGKVPDEGDEEAKESMQGSAEAVGAKDGEKEMDIDDDGDRAAEREAMGFEAEDTIRSGFDEVHVAEELVDGNGSKSEDEDTDNDDVEPSLYMPVPATERKNKELDIHIGGLARDAVEEDLIKVFSEFGELQSVKIVRNPVSKKSKGFAFIRYSTVEVATNALAQLKDGIEVKGKQVRVSASQENTTLYLGNICKTWSKDQVVDALKGLGIEKIEHIVLPADPTNEEKTKGFAFLEFSSRSDAMAAFQRLRKPDAVLGRDRSAKVAFSQTPMNPNEELLLKVKTVYLEHIPITWDEDQIKEHCKEYGGIDGVQLYRKSSRTKKKDFAFVEFASRGSAIACVEGINNAQIGEGGAVVCANLARPLSKGRLAKQGARGGFKVNTEGESPEEAKPSKKKKAKSKEVMVQKKPERTPEEAKAKPSQKEKAKSMEVMVQKKPERKRPKYNKSKGKLQGDASGGKPQASEPVKGNKRGSRGMDSAVIERPLKKARKNHDARQRTSSNFHAGQPSRRSGIRPTVYPPRYDAGYQSYSHSVTYGSNLRHSDLEPHAGYLPATKPIRNAYAYNQTRVGLYDSHQRSGAAFAGEYPVPQTVYPGYTSYAGYQAGYSYNPPSGQYPGSSTYVPRRAYH